MRLNITSQDDNVTCVACAGDICQTHFPAGVNNPLEEMLGEFGYTRRVVMDLGESSFIDSSGVCWLMACHKRFLNAGGNFVLYAVPPMIDQVLRLLHLHTILTIQPDREAALTALAQPQGKK